MGNGPTGIVIIGNLEFNGVKVLKSDVKKTLTGENLNCVWTDAGYFEYKDQPLLLCPGGNKMPVARALCAEVYHEGIPDELKSSPYYDKGRNAIYIGKDLSLMNITDGKFIPSGDEYVSHNSRLNPDNEDISSISIFGRAGDERDYSTFTVDMRNGKKDYIYKQFSDAVVLTDTEDTVEERKVSDIKKGSFDEAVMEMNKKQKYDR